jgi:Ca2+/Na+ antiporter
MRRKIVKYILVAVTATVVFFLLAGDTSQVNTPWVVAPVLVFTVVMLHFHTERVWEYVLERLGGPLIRNGEPRFQIHAQDRLLHRARHKALRKRLMISVGLLWLFFAAVLGLMRSVEGAARYTATLTVAWVGASFLYADSALRKRDDILFDARLVHAHRRRPMNLFTVVDDLCFLYWVAPDRTYREQFGSVIDNRRLQKSLRTYSVAGRDFYRQSPDRWLKLSLVAVLLTCRYDRPDITHARLDKLWNDARSMRVKDIRAIYQDFLRRIDARDYALRCSVESILVQRTPPLPRQDVMRKFLHEPSLN